MVFSSHLFIFYFLPLAIAIYYAMPIRFRQFALALLSYIFYGWANPWFVLLLLGSTVVDYLCGLSLSGRLFCSPDTPVACLEVNGDRTSRQKLALAISVTTNLSLLAIFKYLNFGIDSFNQLLAGLGFEEYQYRNFIRMTLPLGISFYTFQSMSYSIDIFRGRAKAVRNFVDFACYVAMFPQLVAGPIVRFHEVAAQLNVRTHTREKFARGVSIFCMGMAKKVLIADSCGFVADMTFGTSSLSVLDAWLGIISYAFQIYFDFSAYSDMAIGLGLLFGFVFPVNFDAPYRAQSITEFWQRWHLSLSRWLRDYLYIPLGGNRRGRRRTYANLAVVMVLGGLWHGASWNFVLWGSIHGGLLALERMQGKQSLFYSLPRACRSAMVFLVVVLTWVLFRAETLGEALHYWQCLFGLIDVDPSSALIGGVIYQPFYVITVFAAAMIVWTAPQAWQWTQRITWSSVVICLLLFAASLVLVITRSYSPFIYFIF